VIVGSRARRRPVEAAAPGQAEIEDADPAVAADHDVGRLEVAMDQADGVGGGEAAAGGLHHLEDLAHRARLRPQPLAQRRAGDELHGEEDVVAEHTDVVDRDGVRMRQPRQRLGFAQEPLRGAIAILAIEAEDLNRNLAVQVRVVGLVDDRGAAAVEELARSRRAWCRPGAGLLDGYRQKVFLMTKIDGRSYAEATRQLDTSLERLRTDCIDLVQHHEILRYDDPHRIFDDEGAGALRDALAGFTLAAMNLPQALGYPGSPACRW
jgi:hypothetical protein